ncbi:hypothetical protein E5676_scaffold1428G00140 [Cucumis melo var. makuwa]|uniref:Uncharacterized protein n=1 Tax=Cucumis melo var. makuwa TaxID=1194695 RepID=A0A5D3DF45_CUCMM|nr:hypothetical protein E6C27_scaffold80G002720 [Cucumis melo var. makuwa]TYK22311.1 hypothetical protein E5676_scaffold1428G00140 [Cucumis melo var. makuwa]
MFVIQLLLGNDQAFAVRSTTLIHRPSRSDQTSLSCFAVSDQLLLRDDQILPSDPRPSRSDRTSTSCITVNDPTSTRGQSSIDVRSTVLVEVIGHLCCASLSAVQLRLKDDQAFAIRSTALVGAIRHLRRALQSMIQLLLKDDRAFTVRSTVLVGTVKHFYYASPSTI